MDAYIRITWKDMLSKDPGLINSPSFMSTKRGQDVNETAETKVLLLLEGLVEDKTQIIQNL